MAKLFVLLCRLGCQTLREFIDVKIMFLELENLLGIQGSGLR